MRQAFGDDLADRARIFVGNAELAANPAADETSELYQHGIVETELLAQLGAVLQRRVLSDHVVDGVADEAEERKGDDTDGQHHRDGLDQAAKHESDHGVGCFSRAALPRAPALDIAPTRVLVQLDMGEIRARAVARAAPSDLLISAGAPGQQLSIGSRLALSIVAQGARRRLVRRSRAQCRFGAQALDDAAAIARIHDHAIEIDVLVGERRMLVGLRHWRPSGLCSAGGQDVELRQSAPRKSRRFPGRLGKTLLISIATTPERIDSGPDRSTT
jgi:hypothetical protein